VTRLAAALIVLALLGLGGCKRSEKSDSAHAQHRQEEVAPSLPDRAEVEVPPERRQMLGVRTAVVERRALVREIRTVGIVDTDERRVRKIQTKISGWVEQLFASFTGELVKAGTPILSIYSPELVASQREYLLALESAPTDASDSGLLLDSARNRLLRFDLTLAQVHELERTREVKRAITLHAPIGGFVIWKPVYQGMYVTPEMELYTIADLDQVWIWADLTEDESSLVQPGMSAVIELSSRPGESFEAVVSYVSPVLDSVTRTVRARLDAGNAEGALKPGMYATVRLERPLGVVLALPEDAVIDTGERRTVFVEIEPGRYQPRDVGLGRRGGSYVEVLSGLEAGERVAVSAQFLLDSESRLRAPGRGPPIHEGH